MKSMFAGLDAETIRAHTAEVFRDMIGVHGKIGGRGQGEHRLRVGSLLPSLTAGLRCSGTRSVLARGRGGRREGERKEGAASILILPRPGN